MLPATGAPVSRHRTSKMKEMFDDYVRTRTRENWTFWIVSFCVSAFQTILLWRGCPRKMPRLPVFFFSLNEVISSVDCLSRWCWLSTLRSPPRVWRTCAEARYCGSSSTARSSISDQVCASNHFFFPNIYYFKSGCSSNVSLALSDTFKHILILLSK